MGSAGEEAEQVFVEFLLVRAGQPVRCARVDLEDRVRHDLGGLEGRGTDVQLFRSKVSITAARSSA